MELRFQEVPIGQHDDPVAVGDEDFAGPLGRERRCGCLHVRLTGQSLGLDDVGLEDVDHRQDLFLLGPGKVLEAAVRMTNPDEALCIRTDDGVFLAQFPDRSRSETHPEWRG